MTSKNKVGRPKSVDMEDEKIAEQVKQFGSLAATQEEMANWFECSVRTIERLMADKEGKFCRVYKSAESTFNQSLRRMQIKAASKGNATMLIWLGKQRLKQSDVSKVEVAGDPDAPLKTESKIDIKGTAELVREILN